MKKTSNYIKHTKKNPIQQYFINKFYRKLIKEAEKTKPGKILDAGCGEGFTLEKLRKKGIGEYLEGIDSLEEAIEIGKEIHPELNLKTADIYKLPYADNSFDLVICTEVLEHLRHPEKALEEIRRVTKKYVILSVPNEPYFMAANFFRGKNLSRFGNDIEHINHWSSIGFKTFVSSKFKIKTFKTLSFLTMIRGEKA